MRKPASILFLASCLMVLPGAISAQEPEPEKTAAPQQSAPAQEDQGPLADATIGRMLDQMGYKYEIDDDKDYVLVREVKNANASLPRTQQVFINSNIDMHQGFATRQILSRVWRPARKDQPIPAAIANRLLAASYEYALGHIGKSYGDMGDAWFIVRIAHDADSDTLRRAIDVVVESADALELELEHPKGRDAL